MDVDRFVSRVREQLAAAAALGDDRAQQVATVLAAAADPAVRLAIVGALSAAADEITAALLDSPGAPAVTVSLDADDIRVDVRAAASADDDATDEPPPDDADATARISLRLTESLKTAIETAARSDGLSVNAWLVRAATIAVARRGSGEAPFRGRRAGVSHVTGWING